VRYSHTATFKGKSITWGWFPLINFDHFRIQAEADE
jgi:hypothetical protein